MRRASRSKPRAVRVLAVIAGACASAGAMAAVACITTPPPDLPTLPPSRPTVLHQSVTPAEGLLLEWPSDETFTVYVQVTTPGETFVYTVFLDSNAVAGQNVPPQQLAPDGGNVRVSFTVPTPDTAVCPHHLEFIVAHGFLDSQRHTPDAIGGDVVNWDYYNLGPGGPSGCPPLDAGTGAFPEASADVLPVPPSPDGGDQ